MKQGSSTSPSSGGGEPARPPPSIPDHELLRRIGHGGYGEVWLARSLTGAFRAVKVVYRHSFEERRPFDREFEGIKRFEHVSRSHPSQMDILHVGRNEQDEYFYYVMELADDRRTGQKIDPDRYEPLTLRSVLKERGRLPVGKCLDIGLALAEALVHLHRAGLVHRDVKPSNVIFVNGLPKLTDIGLVAAVDEHCSFVGTEGYVPLEGPGKAQADIYALGKVLYEMCTGLRATEFPTLPEDWNASSDRDARELNRVVNQACESNVKRRYQTVQELRTDLTLLMSNKSVLRIRALERKVRGLVLTLAATVVGLFLVMYAWFLIKSALAERTRQQTLAEAIHPGATASPLQAGWFTNTWAQLERAAAIRKGDDLVEKAAASLAGEDARPLAVLKGTGAGSAAIGPDGQLLLGGTDPTATAMLIETNLVTRSLPVQGEGPVCWTPDGVPLQLTMVSNRVILREALTGNARREFMLENPLPTDTNSPPVLAISLKLDAVAAAAGERVVVWNPATGELIGQIAGAFTALAFSPDGSLLGAGGGDGITRVYRIPSLVEIATLIPAWNGRSIQCLAFARDRLVRRKGHDDANAWLVATGDKGTRIVIWDLQFKTPRAFCGGSTWTVTGVAFSPDGVTLASSGRNDPRLWDVRSGRPILTFRHDNGGNSRALAFDASGRRLLCGGEAGEKFAVVSLWELEPHRGIQVLRGLTSATRKVWFSPDSRLVAAASDDWQLAVWDIASGWLQFIFELPAGPSYIESAGGCFDRTGTRFAFAAGREARLYDLTTGKTLREWTLAEGRWDQLEFDGEDRLRLVRAEQLVVDEQREIWAWRSYVLGDAGSPDRRNEQSDTTWSVRDLRFIPGGQQFLVWEKASTNRPCPIRLIDVATGHELWTLFSQTTNDLRLCLDPSGRWLACQMDRSGALDIMRLPDLRPIGRMSSDYQAISPSGEQLAGHERLSLSRSEPDYIPLRLGQTLLSWVCAFSPCGRLVAHGTAEGSVVIVHLDEVRLRLAKFRE